MKKIGKALLTKKEKCSNTNKSINNKRTKVARWPPLMHVLAPRRLHIGDLGGIAGLNALSAAVNQNIQSGIMDALNRAYGGLLYPAMKITGDYWDAAGRMWNTLGLLGWREAVRKSTIPWYLLPGAFGEPVFPVAPFISRGGMTVFGPPVGFVS
jgi:hypothetical protein